MKSVRVLGALVLSALGLTGQVWGQGQEQEPNDSARTATPVTRGNTYNATIGPFNQTTSEGDRDYYKITANAGDTIFVDIDADEFGSKMDMMLTLFASDGTTFLAGNDDWDGMDPQITYVATTTGTYFVRTGTSLETSPWQTSLPYSIHFFKVTCPANDAEPNNSPQTATAATVGQSMRAMSCPGADVDWFKYTLEPGTVEFNFVMDPHERPSFGSAVEIAGWIALYAADGSTQLARTPGEETPDRLEYTVTTRGTYYIRADIYPGGVRYTYTLSSKLVSAPAAGDPTTTRATMSPWLAGEGGVVAPNGDLLFSNWSFRGLRRVSPQGTVSEIPLDIDYAAGLAYDAAGNLLIVNFADAVTAPASEGGVFKLSPSGQLTRFITDAHAGMGIAVARDGSIWLGAWETKKLLHYDAEGRFLASYDVSAASGNDGPRYLAMSPSGDPHFSTQRDIYRLRNGSAERLIHYDHTPSDNPGLDIEAFAFDVQGNIYVPNAHAGVVNLHDATGKWLETFSYGPDAPRRVLFGRNADGTTNSRLYAIDGNKLIEFNAAGVRAPGFPVQPPQGSQNPSTPTTAQAVAELLKPGSLSAAQLQQLDQQGNRNGRYDVGDLRALLIRNGVLAASTRALPD